MTNQSTRHRQNHRAGQRALRLLLLFCFVFGQLLVTMPANVALAHSETPPPAPVPRAVDGVQAHTPQADAALDAPPSQEEGTQVNPFTGETVYYGSELGRQQLAPSMIAGSAAVSGPEVSVGAWRSLNIQAGTRTTTAIVGAPDGRLFVGVSGDGLRIYAPDANGVYSWTAVQAEANGLASNNVTALAIFQNELWVGTANAGISKLNLSTDQWTTLNSGNSGLPSNVIARLTPVAALGSTGEHLWVSTNAGAARWMPGSPGTWMTLNTGSGLPSNNVLDVAVQYVGTTPYTWIATDSDSGLARWVNNSVSTVLRPNGCAMDRATRLGVDRNGFLWVNAEQNIPGRAGDAVDVWVGIGICRFFLLSGWTNFNSGTHGLPGNTATAFAADDDGRMWVSFNGGIAVNDVGGWFSYTSPTYPLASNNVSALAAIGESIWLGHGGVTSLTQFATNWASFTPGQMNGAGTPRALLLEETTAWVGVGSGVSRRTESGWSHHPIPGNSANVRKILRDGEGNLWLGTAGNGLWRWDGANGFTHFPAGGADGLPGNNIRDLLMDSGGRLWVATQNGLAMRGANYWLIFNTDNSGLPSNDLLSLAADNSGRLWIGSNGSGIATFTPNGPEGWQVLTGAAAPASPVINGLLRDNAGVMWAATNSGLGRWNAATQNWTTFTAANGLPHARVFSLATDPAGNLWVGTARGMARYAGGQWGRALRVIESALDANRVTALATDGTYTWAVAGNHVSVRGPLGQPLGRPAPTITAFTPGQGVPTQTEITITGTNFDSRGPDYNQVYFYNASPAYQATVLSATSTSLVVKAPNTTRTGKIYVRANNQFAISAQDFQVTPQITSVAPEGCAALGSVVGVTGWGLAGLGSFQTYVRVGNGNWRLADSFGDNTINIIVRPGDTTGKVQVRLGQSGPIVSSASDLTVGALDLTEAHIQQAIEGEQLIWGKRTLVQLGVKMSQPGCSMTLTGRMDWKKKSGTLHAASVTMSPITVTVNSHTDLGISLTQRPNFVGEWETARSSYTDLFPLSDFDGARVTLRNNGIVVLTADFPVSAFKFVDTGIQHRYVFQGVVSTMGASPTFWADAVRNMRHFARYFPQQDVSPFSGPRYWLTWTSTPLFWDNVMTSLKKGHGTELSLWADELDRRAG